MSTIRTTLAMLLIGSLGLVGCTRYQPVPLYQLNGGEWQMPENQQGLALLLGPVVVADYLQREALLQRQPDESLVTAEDARWAGNLARDIEQQLLRQLAARLDSQRVQLAPATPGFEPALRLGLSITRLDSGPQQPAVLDAQWRLSGADGKLLDGRLVRLQQPHRGTLADQVQAQSQLLQQLAGLLVEATRQYGHPAPLVAPPPARKPAANKPAQPPAAAPRIPVAEPSRNEAEVFRF